jgi:hypothetical protein
MVYGGVWIWRIAGGWGGRMVGVGVLLCACPHMEHEDRGRIRPLLVRSTILWIAAREPYEGALTRTAGMHVKVYRG